MSSIPISQWPSTYRYSAPVAGDAELVTLTIDGVEVEARRGELLIKVAQEHGTYIPRFCYHERMQPVGMCRMCLVTVEGMRGLQISCATPVTEGMVVITQSPEVKGAQDGVLEFLLINHPLDCPVCDRGGECPLQDQTLAFGPGESRFVEEKRHFEKPIPISDLILLDRERCIQCGRCTRFAVEVAGDPLIDFGGRGAETEVITYPGKPFSSYFSGNVVQICPVGALTARSYRFKARPWDLNAVETSCQTCSVGCRGVLDSSSNRLVRFLGVDSEPINHGWLCDKGRYGYEWVHAKERFTTPLAARGGGLVPESWPQALDSATALIRSVFDNHGADAIGVLGGSHGTNEDAYAWARLAKGVIGTDNVDAQMGDGLPAEVVLGMERATIADLDRARAIVLLGPDLKEELPVLYLRVRRAVVDLGVPLVDIGARDTGLTPYATAVLRHLPGDPEAVTEQLAGALAGQPTRPEALRPLLEAIDLRAQQQKEGPVVVILGRSSLAEAPDATVRAAAILAQVGISAKFLSALPSANVHGALDLGLTPGFLPGRVTLAAGGERLADKWKRLPKETGLDTAGILHGAVEGKIKLLVLLNCDPISEFPDSNLAQAALAKVDHVISLNTFANASMRHAEVVFPLAAWGEQRGSISNLEGRVSRLGRKIAPDGSTMDGWRIAAELAARLGMDFDLESVNEVQDEIAQVAPAFVGVDSKLISWAIDGAVLPVADHAADITFALSALDQNKRAAGVSWEPIPTRAESSEGQSAGESSNGEVPAAAVSPPRPDLPLYIWSQQAPERTAALTDSYSLRLVASATLYGSDLITTQTPALARLANTVAELRVNEHERDRLGVVDGEVVRVISSRASIELPLIVDPSVPERVAFVAVNRVAPGATDLIDISDAVTDLRIETLPKQSGGA